MTAPLRHVQSAARLKPGIKKAASMTKRPACNILSPYRDAWQALRTKFVLVMFIFLAGFVSATALAPSASPARVLDW